MHKKRVVITGIGSLTSLGSDANSSWQEIISSKSGVSVLDDSLVKRLPCKIGSIIHGFKPEDYIPARDVRKMDRFIHLGIAAAQEAIKDSDWIPSNEYEKERTGVIVGSGIGGLGTIENTSVEIHKSDRIRITPYFIPASLANLLPGHIAIEHGFSGPNVAVSTACATGAHAIGDATRIIRNGEADVMVAGGAEAPMTLSGLSGFVAARTLATNFNHSPTEASRPWDEDRAGFVMGEGAGVVVIEEYEHAKKRNAKIYAEILGYGATCDAFHITTPNGKGAMNAVKNALKEANIAAEKVDYINAHSTSTKIGDKIEIEVIQELFSENKSIKMSSTKSSIGHSLGATGAVEIIFTALSMRDQIAPPTLNLQNPITDNINLVPLYSQDTKISYALSNSFGFGGTNASIILGKI